MSSYKGWNHDEMLKNAAAQSTGAPVDQVNSSDLLAARTGFTAINRCDPEQSSSSFHVVSNAADEVNDANTAIQRHPTVLANHLGLSRKTIDHNSIDRLAINNIVNDSSLEANNKALQSRSRKRTLARQGNAVKRAKLNLQPCAEAQISPSENIIQQVKKWNYQPQAFKPPTILENMRQNSSSTGTISLLAPVTSFDRALASQGQYTTIHDTSTPQSEWIDRQHNTPIIRPPGRRRRRAPSTGHILEPILEEIQLNNPLRTPDLKSVSYWSNMPSTSLQPPDIDAQEQQFLYVEFHHDAHLQVVNEVPENLELLFDEINDDDFASVVDELTEKQPRGPDVDTDCQTDQRVTRVQPQHDLSISYDFDPVSTSTVVTSRTREEGNSDDTWPTISEGDIAILDMVTSDDVYGITGSEISHEPIQAESIAFLSTSAQEITKPTQQIPTARAPYITHCHAPPPSTPILPIVRPHFPLHLRDRSPLLNISSTLTLKTCFRIGEAMNIGTHYACQSSSDTILIELYARVLYSWRPDSGTRQDFIFVDLWSNKGPRLKGEWLGWKGSEVFEKDAGACLMEGQEQGSGGSEKLKMCRIMGRLRKEKMEKKGWVLDVVSIWECGWEDVEMVGKIVCGR